MTEKPSWLFAVRVSWFVPRLACPRRLCQPPWTQPSLSETTHLTGGTKQCRNTRNSNASRSSGGSAREGLLSEKPPPSHTPTSVPLFGEGLGEALLLEKRPLPESPSFLYCFCEIVEGGFVELGAAEGDSWLNDGDFLHLGQHALHGPHRRRAPRAVFDQAEGALLIVLDK